MTPEQIAEAGQRLARLEQWLAEEYADFAGYQPALKLAQQALREWVPREDREQALKEYGIALHLKAMGIAECRDHRGLARRLLKLEDTP